MFHGFGHHHFARWAGHDPAFDGPGPFMGRGHGPGGRRGWFGFGHGGPPGFDFRAGRKLSSADLQLLLLALLGEKERHGYDLIKAIEERSKGFYVPSPGVIYPALTYLEEAGDVSAEAQGARKLYSLTDAGRARLEGERANVDELVSQLDELGRKMGRLREALGGDEAGEEDPRVGHGELRAAMRDLALTLRQSRRGHRARIVAVIERATAEIRRIVEGEDRE
jgi:DNA-binding PadR family transcriptional regulator